VQQCKFFGFIRIGKLESFYLEFHDLRLPVGLYNSYIISSDIGDNVVINNVNYLSHYLIGNEVMLVNVNEIEVSDHAKFGNGIVKQGEKENIRIWLEICNENAGRRVMPFDGMQAADAWLWSRYRDDEALMQKFKLFTEKIFDDRRGYYGRIGDRTIIKNSRIIKDANIGSDAYIKGANKLKNITINSSAESPTQIGEGCELVNGIIGYGCKAFYGAKAVRFILASHSQLKYGARLINSFLGDNSTISCCEVLNSLIFPAHEQHHNNSFLCASVLKGQSNMAAGATIGSNHNSRGADGEIIAGRGFWPGLCVSLKHNSRFASFTLIAKGDYPAELDIRIPFSLVSNDAANDKLLIMPAYWFMYNMYALARNSGKYESRDKRAFKNQYFEYDFLAPDSVNEIFTALQLIKKAVGDSVNSEKQLDEPAAIKAGEKLLEQRTSLDNIEVLIPDVENSTRKVELLKVTDAYHIYKELIIYYGAVQMVSLINSENIHDFETLLKKIGSAKRTEWVNSGGQLLPEHFLKKLLNAIHRGGIDNWNDVHRFYKKASVDYPLHKAQHAFAALLELLHPKEGVMGRQLFFSILQQALVTKEWMVNGIYESRAKDYDNAFRKMVYQSHQEMEKIVGKLKDNSFIIQQQQELSVFQKQVAAIVEKFKLEKSSFLSKKQPNRHTRKVEVLP
jgi:NDP-sugar pyrophosphorylase family protein